VDEQFGFPGNVERMIYRSAHQRRWLLISQSSSMVTVSGDVDV